MPGEEVSMRRRPCNKDPLSNRESAAILRTVFVTTNQYAGYSGMRVLEATPNLTEFRRCQGRARVWHDVVSSDSLHLV